MDDHVARFIRGILDALAVLLGLYYSKKYAAIARRLGLPPITASERRGFVIIQIDGLAHAHLQTAIARGYAPYLGRLIRRQDFFLSPWRVGLPGTTPAVQAGIMFGDNDDIPAYRWYNKRKGESVRSNLPASARAIRERIGTKRPGILTGGSSYMNMLDGDASLSMFTLGTLNRQRFFEGVKGIGFLLIFALNPLRGVTTFVLAVWEYLTDLYQRTSALVRQQNPRPLERKFPFLRVMSNVVLRDIQTFAVMIDVYRGAPAIYTTYFGYDEVAHHYGLVSKPALRALRAIDTRIRRIDSMRRMALTREYDLYILSDHGMTVATPFQKTYDRTLGQLIRDLADQRIEFSESGGAGNDDDLQPMYIGEELEVIEANLRPSLAPIPHMLRRLVAKRVGVYADEVVEADLSRRMDLIVRNSGSVSHVYFNTAPRQLDLTEVASLFPSLIDGLVSHPGIWLVVAREGEEVVVMSGGGSLRLDDGYEVEGIDPLGAIIQRRLVGQQLRRLARFSQSGDIILFGSYDQATESVCCFEDLWASHGGIGGPQEIPFLMTEQHIAWDTATVTQATDLYQFFAGRYDIENGSGLAQSSDA